jgi:hypothetical protein
LRVEIDKTSPSIIGVKFPADVRVGKSSSLRIGRLHSGGGGELSKQRSAALGRFAMRMSEVKRAILR